MQTKAPTQNVYASESALTSSPCDSALQQLRQYFGVDFSLLCGSTGDAIEIASDARGVDWSLRSSLCRVVAERQRPELLDERNQTLTLAIPLRRERLDTAAEQDMHDPLVAVADFLSWESQADPGDVLLAGELGVSPTDAAIWRADRSPWGPDALLRMAELATDKLYETNHLQRNIADLSSNLASTYEEITLLYRLSENLRIGEDPARLWRAALDWLTDIVPAKTLAIRFAARESSRDEVSSSEEAKLYVDGPSPLSDAMLHELVELAGPHSHDHTLVFNNQSTEDNPWVDVEVEQLVMVPICAGDCCFGYLLAANHVDDGEFGTVEGSLLSSVASILGIHCSNVQLFHEQAELMSGIVRALSSAIDAKDPYTRGHSDRVARVAVRIAEQMGLPADQTSTIYLSGLLHDVGKIGIADSVLRKPGRLTDAEYEHIKLHPGLGHKILKDIKKIEHVLPGVLHHHEAVNGKGYPDGLMGDNIPLQARIIAVADSFDAMGSDRPYRRGMEESKVDSILRQGAGEQWDSEVIDAFFAARDDIREIAQEEDDTLQLDFHFMT